MNTILNWSLESTLVLSILFLVYFLCFRNNTSIKLRRKILQGIVLISILSPLLKFDVSHSQRWLEHPVIELDEKIISTISVTELEETTIDTPTDLQPTEAPIDYQLLAYQIGGLAFLTVFMIQIGRIILIITLGQWKRENKLIIINHGLVKAPSSFLFAILMPKEITLDPKDKKIIIEHEKQHIQQKHSLDILLVTILQIFTWFNPMLFWIRSEFKNIHEALADRATLKTVNNKEYLRVLLASAFSTYSTSLSHCFGQKYGLVKRIRLIQKQQTTMKKTALSLFAFSIVSLGIIGINVLNAQDVKSSVSKVKEFEVLTSQEIEKMSPRERTEYIMNLRAKEEGYPRVSSREEALELTKSHLYSPSITQIYIRNKLNEKFKKVLNRLETIYPEADIAHRYLNNPSELDYQGNYLKTNSPLYIGKLEIEDKKELIDLAKEDSSRLKGISLSSRTYPVYRFDILELGNGLENNINNRVNFIMFYETRVTPDSKIYNAKNADILPNPVGGLEAFERAIALDIAIPESIDPTVLPKTIDFSAVIYGGKQLNSLNLLTRVKGNKEETKKLYLFYGKVLKEIQNKTRDFYSWKPGIKDGKEVIVRMKISIPTKYMM